MTNDSQQPADAQPDSDDQAAALPSVDGGMEGPVLTSEDLLQGQKQVLIEHQGEIYRLLVTRNGKLILQK